MGAYGDQHEDRADVARDALQQGQSLIPEIRPDQILVIGDTERDIQCARTIGAKVLAVATGSSTVSELESFKPDWITKDLTHIHPADFT